MEDIWRWIWNAISVRDLKYIGISNIVHWIPHPHYLNVACFAEYLTGFYIKVRISSIKMFLC